MLALVHDLAEAQVGDITPHEPISKAEKRKLEAVSLRDIMQREHAADGWLAQDAMDNFVKEMFHESPAGQRILRLWQVSRGQGTVYICS